MREEGRTDGGEEGAREEGGEGGRKRGREERRSGAIRLIREAGRKLTESACWGLGLDTPFTRSQSSSAKEGRADPSQLSSSSSSSFSSSPLARLRGTDGEGEGAEQMEGRQRQKSEVKFSTQSFNL